MRFVPHVTVATIIEDQGRFLMVEEYRDGRLVLNQPAGRWESIFSRLITVPAIFATALVDACYSMMQNEHLMRELSERPG